MLFTEFQPRLTYLAKVHEAFQKLKEFDFLALAGAEGSIEGQAGCRFSLEAELKFAIGLPLKIECFSTNPHATKWVTQTLICILSNLGIKEVFDTYHGPDLECYVIRDNSETFVEIY
ncbi:MAG: hypothetical protein Q8T09_02950 [Candidatus Melainabacteria bacterium]|nr:hypothetical protein [Candidatus Melainabacteria bacterium]